jgi:transcriptional regulator with XRE-family HTH domain
MTMIRKKQGIVAGSRFFMGIKSRLEHGDVKRIARRLGLSRTTITKALRGEIRNIRIVQEAIRVAQINAKVYESLSEITKKTKKN